MINSIYTIIPLDNKKVKVTNVQFIIIDVIVPLLLVLSCLLKIMVDHKDGFILPVNGVCLGHSCTIHNY